MALVRAYAYCNFESRSMHLTDMRYYEKWLTVLALFAAASVFLFHVTKRMPLGPARVLATLPFATAMMAAPFIFNLETELLSRCLVGAPCVLGWAARPPVRHTCHAAC